MEKTLKVLFDFQHFHGNHRLARIIAETEDRCSKPLNDDDLSFVSAAGVLSPAQQGEDGDDLDA